jgi:hypothetical protein
MCMLQADVRPINMRLPVGVDGDVVEVERMA